MSLLAFQEASSLQPSARQEDFCFQGGIVDVIPDKDIAGMN